MVGLLLGVAGVVLIVGGEGKAVRDAAGAAWRLMSAVQEGHAACHGQAAKREHVHAQAAPLEPVGVASHHSLCGAMLYCFERGNGSPTDTGGHVPPRLRGQRSDGAVLLGA